MVAEFARFVKGIRTMLGITQRELGKRSGLSRSIICRIETAYSPRPPALDALARIAKAAGGRLSLTLTAK